MSCRVVKLTQTIYLRECEFLFSVVGRFSALVLVGVEQIMQVALVDTVDFSFIIELIETRR